ncbi:glycosyltransferase family 2 protein [Candidatus Parcubacteria bacterium]|nr:MAG: glycosyltransferase family 2 protein [Candidatus Parcubacteria bacterium]
MNDRREVCMPVMNERFLAALQRLPYFRRLLHHVYALHDELDLIKSRMDVPDELFHRFQKERDLDDYQEVYEREEPLVSVYVPTYNRCALLVERAVRSVLNQDYPNFELIVVGDHCTDNTAELLAGIDDRRLRFVNLPERGAYPRSPEWRWMVAGISAVNHALGMVRGDFITQLDDDDEYTPDRLGCLVRFARETRADVIWHPFWRETSSGKWQLHRAERFRRFHVTNGSVFYHRWFSSILFDENAYMLREPGDWNRFRKFVYLGARTLRYPHPLLRHYRERNQTAP